MGFFIDMDKIKCTILTSDSDLRAELSALVGRTTNLEAVRGLNGSPSPEAILRFLRTSPARVVFLDVRSDDAFQIPGEVELIDPGVQFIAVGSPANPYTAWRGIHERIALPLDTDTFLEAVERRLRVLEKLPGRSRTPTSFICFLPAKPGAGTSTLASGLADILAADHKTLLCDFDFTGSTVGFRYRLEKAYSLPEVSEGFEHIDEDYWTHIVSRSRNLDILPSSIQPGTTLRVDFLPAWFDFLRATYDTVIFDLSGHLEDFSLDIMRESRQTFLVTTQELECLHLGRAKADALRTFGLGEQTSILLNRFHKNHTLKAAEVEELLHFPVRAQFPNDYAAVQEAVRSGSALKRSSALAKALHSFAPFADAAPEKPAQAHKFLEFVNLPAFNYWRRLEMRSER